MPVAIGTSITNLAKRSLDFSDFNHASQSWKTVCYNTQTKRQVQTWQLKKGIVKTTKSVTLLPFSTTAGHGFTKLKEHGMRLKSDSGAHLE